MQNRLYVQPSAIFIDKTGEQKRCKDNPNIIIIVNIREKKAKQR